MKTKMMILVLCSVMTLSSCGTHTGDGAMTGAMFGGLVGSAIGGVSNGHRGYHMGQLIGMASGAVAGAAVGAAADKAENDRREEIRGYHERMERKTRNRDYRPRATSVNANRIAAEEGTPDDMYRFENKRTVSVRELYQADSASVNRVTSEPQVTKSEKAIYDDRFEMK